MACALACAMWTLLASIAPAQNITLKDGTVVETKGVRRLGDNIMATVQLPALEAGKPAAMGEFGYAIANIANIAFPDPGLKGAADLINNGRAADALAQLQPVLKYYDSIGDAPGSWWAAATLLKIRALISLGRLGDAEAAAALMAKTALNPDHTRAANVYVAGFFLARTGSVEKAMDVYEGVLRDAKEPQTLAVAAVYKGLGEVAQKQWAAALLSLLEVPVFYPEEEVLMPSVLLGTGQAYIGLRDFTRAREALGTLSAQYGATPEAAQGQAEMTRLAKLEKALKPLK